MSITTNRQSSADLGSPVAPEKESEFRCPCCGAAVQVSIEGMCPRCLMGLAMGPSPGTGADPKPHSLPNEFGRYRILRQIGQGAMGVVYLAEDSQLKRQVALKVPLVTNSADSSVVQRFNQEVRAAAALRHPHICPIHDFGEFGGTVYMTMSFIEGRPLSDRIERRPQIAVRAAIALVRKVALALSEAHRQGVIHRDLKPANIMIDQRGEPIVMDFGLARQTQTKNLRLTNYGTLVGTPAYMSPEQVAGEYASHRSDIYSLGVVLYELVTGHLPFSGDLVPLLAQIAHGAPVPPSQHRGDVPAAVDAICLKAMAKQPSDRYQTMEEFSRALTDFIVASASGVSDAAGVGASKAEQVTRRRRQLLHAAAFSVGVLCAVGLAVLLVNTYRQSLPSSIPVASTPAVPSSIDLATASVVESLPDVAKTNADEGRVNLLLGRYYCFTEGDWDQGLSLLARSNDRELGALATRDLALSKEPLGPSGTAAVELGDAWCAWSQHEKSEYVREMIEMRAAHWYGRVLSLLPVNDRQRVEHWLDEHQPAPESSRIAAAKQLAPQTTVLSPEDAKDKDAKSALYQSADSSSAGPSPVIASGSKVRSAATAPSAQTPPPRADQQPPLAVVSSEPVDETLLSHALAVLEQIDASRQRTKAAMALLVGRRDVELPQAQQQAANECRRLAMLRDELSTQIRSISTSEKTVRRRHTAAATETARRALEVDLDTVRRALAQARQRYDGMTAELEQWRQNLSDLGSHAKDVNESIVNMNLHAKGLISAAFWASEPTGALSKSGYLRVADEFTAWLKRDDTHPASLALRAIAVANAGKLDAAIEDARRATQLDSSLSLAWAAQGYADLQLGNETEGFAELARAIRIDSKSPHGYLLRGLAHRKRGNDGAALEDLRRVTILDDASPWAHSQLAWQLAASRSAELRDGQKALDAARRACELNSGRSWICFTALAAAQAEMGQYAEAISAQTEALPSVPADRKKLAERQLKCYESRQPWRFD